MSRWIALSTFILAIGMSVMIWNSHEYQNKFIAATIFSYLMFLITNEYEKNEDKRGVR